MFIVMSQNVRNGTGDSFAAPVIGLNLSTTMVTTTVSQKDPKDTVLEQLLLFCLQNGGGASCFILVCRFHHCVTSHCILERGTRRVVPRNLQGYKKRDLENGYGSS